MPPYMERVNMEKKSNQSKKETKLDKSSSKEESKTPNKGKKSKNYEAPEIELLGTIDELTQSSPPTV